MNVRHRASFWFLAAALVVVMPPARAQTPPRDGQHDFDFHVGEWKSNISRLDHPLSGSSTWITCEGTLKAQKVWDGRAQFEELEADCPDHHIEDLLLFLLELNLQ